ncbi:Por secretion system C-terminal sorting domain-containing protein [Reichenbachiella faecimaris]|uniref:Por secretion system C-terminal sorting domain-containing protein n=1 Tax=Reichenbachiella faecimaris TaxID=692418 RepID=A0A1W2G5C0_REIFA|nr:T9SS type A sorting domain-containing protein [Reichenbachiella faecimaris]SMD31860.1 Por secretion system C-terminal sorting domain-containing protein [Reichenbachiella faecimaris]
MKAHKALIATILILIIYSVESKSQQHTIASAGSYSSSGNHQLSWTLGQVSNLSATKNSIYLGVGIHSGQKPITIVSGLSDINQQISIYPNPTTDYVSISPSSGPYRGSYFLINTLGKIVLKKNEVDFSDVEIIEMHHFSNGGYVLRIDLEGQPTQQYKIIKN